MITVVARDIVQWRTLPLALLIIVLVTMAILVGRQWLAGYLFSLWFCLDLALGALVLLLIHGLTTGRWMRELASLCCNAVRTLPLLWLLWLPLLLVLSAVFTWVGVGDSTTLEQNQAMWLQPWFLALRTIFYFTVWLVIASQVVHWKTGSFKTISAARAGASLIVLVPLISLFAVDWLLGLLPGNSTTMIGFLVISGQVAAALALGAVMIGVRYWDQTIDREQGRRCRDVGNLLLAAVMFYGYCLYMDYLIVWEANLPHEILWYQTRTTVFGGQLSAAIVVLHLLLPIILLLFRSVKDRPAGLLIVGVSVLLGHALQIFWYLLPVAAMREFDFGIVSLALIATLFLLACGMWLFIVYRFGARLQEG